MKNYIITGDQLLSHEPKIEFDSKGNKIMDHLNYIITEIKHEGKNMIIIRTEEDYINDKKILKTMVYTQKGFPFLIKTMKDAGLITIEKQEETINSMIDTLASLEDFENAEKLKNDWNEYKDNQDEDE
jgi:hypothetical protein